MEMTTKPPKQIPAGKTGEQLLRDRGIPFEPPYLIFRNHKHPKKEKRIKYEAW
jgi:hypothetical protein